ncbi:MAG: hypothetical protein ACK2T3_14310 [Candidatus Promineifilaceae bacterium]|jgi:UDP-2,3-diacylglucosamine pyrophosphatase LpxH
MLVVLSDLHFEEETSDAIPGKGGFPPVAFSRNLPGKAYKSFITHLASEAVRNRAKKLDLVFAGDIFDMHRTSLWFTDPKGDLRPYVNIDEVGADVEKRVMRILKDIQNEPGVGKALKGFQKMGRGQYRESSSQEFPVPVTIHFIPGNHDRLANATPVIRREVRKALGMEASDAPFPHVLTFPEAGAIVRHGHEYDRHNFSIDLTGQEEIPLHLPDSGYNAPPFGDFATVDIASHIPLIFREVHTDDYILSDEMLRSVYLRLLEFDDLRPQMAMLNFLLHMPKVAAEPAEVWKVIMPVLEKLLEDIHSDPFLLDWLDRMDKKWQIDAIDVIQTALSLKSWRAVGVPLGLAQFISKTAIQSAYDFPGAKTFAAKEAGIRSGEFKFVIAGHTHNPATELIAADSRGERYYIDTGTWRNRIPATPDFKAFGRLKTLTYVIVYGPDEDKGEDQRQEKIASFDFWSGVTQRWHA